MIYVDTEKCDGCGLCIESCPEGALKLGDGGVHIDQASCRSTRACLLVCPQGALLELVEPEERRDHPVSIAEAALAKRGEGVVAKKNVGMTFLETALHFFVSDVAPVLWRRWLNKRPQPSTPAAGAARPITRGRCRGGAKLRVRRRKGRRT